MFKFIILSAAAALVSALPQPTGQPSSRPSHEVFDANCVNEPGTGQLLGGGEGIGFNATFLDIYLWDSFGDGWNNSWFALRNPAGDVKLAHPTCDSNPVHSQINPCANLPHFGSYSLSILSALGAVDDDDDKPQGWWEILWTVQVLDGEGNALSPLYVGGFNTTMIWDYDVINDVWTLEYTENLADEAKVWECKCTGGKCKPKPKPKSGKGKKGSKDIVKGSGDSSDSDSSRGENRTYGPRAVNLRVDMFSDDSVDGWTDIAGTFGLGAHWYIADSTRTRLFDDGALCSGNSGSCNICLGDGSYVFRVTGPGNTNVSAETWGFCNVRGHLNNQLNFHVKKGECIPDTLRYVDDICEGIVDSVVVVIGYVALGGISTEFFSVSDAAVVKSALAGAVNGWADSTLQIVSTGLDARSLSEGRALNSFTHDVIFSVSFHAETYGVDGTIFANVENLVSDMASTLAATFQSGVFSTQLVSGARLAGSDLFGEGVTAELISLDVSGVSYTGNKMVYYYDSESASVSSSSEESSMSMGMIILIATVAAVGFVAFVGVAAHGFNGYSKLAMQSEHEAVLAESNHDSLFAGKVSSTQEQKRVLPRVAI